MSKPTRRLENQIKTCLWRGLETLFGGGEKRQAVDLDRVRSVLVVRPDRLGDLILSTPVYESLRASLPGARVTVVAEKGSANLLLDNPSVHRILKLDRRRPWKILKSLRQEPVDLAITLTRAMSATATWLTRLSGAPIRVGYYHPENAWAHTLTVPHDDRPRHEILNNLELLRALHLPTLVETPKLYFSDAENRAIDTLFKEIKRFPEKPTVLVKPGTRVAEWGWRLEKFRALAEELSHWAEVFIIAGPGEDRMIQALLEPMREKPRRLPPLSAKSLACAIKRADLLVCNHTGIMHMASAVNTPVVAIFKHGEIFRWGPWNTPHRVLEERNSDALPPETVAEAAKQLLNGK